MSFPLNILAFATGTALLQQQAELPGLQWAMGLLPLAIVIRWLWHVQTAGLLLSFRMLLWLFCLGVGFFWAAGCAQWRLADKLPETWERRDIQLIGVVASIPQQNDHSVRFQLNVEHVITEGAVVPDRIVLAWYRERQADVVTSTIPVIRAGQRWKLTVRLKQPHGSANPHGFDYEAWALERNIRAGGYVRSSTGNQLLNTEHLQPAIRIEQIREHIQQNFTTNLADKAYTGVLKTLATGDQNAISRDQWQIFINTGTSHLMAISGLHITLISSMVFVLVSGLWRRSAYLTTHLPARRAAALAGLIAAFGYAVLSGFAIPAQRAFYMLTVVAIVLWRGDRISATSVLAWALFWVVLLDPWASVSPGFWLSFGAIVMIMQVTAGRIGKMHWFNGWLNVQWAITLGLIPLLLFLFQQISLVSLIANAVAIPLMSFVVVPLTLIATVPVFDFLLPLAHAVITIIMEFLGAIGNLPYAVWQQHMPPLWAIVAAIGGILWLLLPGSLGTGFLAGFPARWLGVIALLPMFLVQPDKPGNGELWLTVLDVGQGLAVVARTEQHALLFDTGPGFIEMDSGGRIIVPFLRGEGIQRLDAMIVSHADTDHSGGAFSVMKAIPVERLWSSLDDHHPIQRGVQHRQRCRSGVSWQWDGVNFELLHPLEQDYDDPSRSTNANSCVLKITSIHGSVLLPADIEKKSEQALLERAADKLPATILIAPHHGSQSSSTEAFVQAVSPAVTIFPVGYLNRHDHPREVVLDRYRHVQSQLLRSDRDGAILLRFLDNGWSVERWRKSRRRYWQRDFVE